MFNYIKQLKYKNIAIYLIIAIFFILDRILKLQALKQLTPIKLSNILSFKFIPNYNIAFSLPISGAILNIIIFFIIFSIIFIIIKNRYDKIITPILIMLLLGALSNFMDRLIYGYVIDYLYIKHFTILNLSDVMISLSVLLLIIYNNRINSKQI